MMTELLPRERTSARQMVVPSSSQRQSAYEGETTTTTAVRRRQTAHLQLENRQNEFTLSHLRKDKKNKNTVS
jgi:hypothetical protein